MNRNDLQDVLEASLQQGETAGRPFGLILFSVDRFKLVNGRFGHALADRVLTRIHEIARAALRDRGRIGRWAGDEFLCVLPGADTGRGEAIALELRQAIAHAAIPIDSSIINVTASFGVADFPHDGTNVQGLLLAADEALYQAKQRGRNRVVCAGSLEQYALAMGNVLDTALREDRVMPAYQPIVDLKSGETVAEEALARIVTTDGEAIAAERFMDVASQFQLTHKIDRTVVLSAFGRYLSHLDGGRPLTHFVNISGDLLRHPELFRELLESVRRLYVADGGPAARDFPLVIEITEREILGSPELTRQMLMPFVELGLRLALDDFGSGYSSFHYLADLPVSFLKIDGRFTQRLHEPKVRAIVHGIQNTATELGLITLAEHVETEAQAEILRRIGINWAQGHHYGAAALDQEEADVRRQMSVNWARGYYYQKDQ
ncbi:MAG TPA: bifunctional diguanylate cyclase/phosphodiesterase [Acidiferrobacterales bacterium]